MEGRIEGHGIMMDGIREAVGSLEQRMDRRFELIEQRMDRRFDLVEQRLTAMDTRGARQFTWLMGILVTSLASVVAALLIR